MTAVVFKLYFIKTAAVWSNGLCGTIQTLTITFTVTQMFTFQNYKKMKGRH